MATYYARSTGGNWSANTSWDSTSSAGAGPAGPPVAGDTAIFDSSFSGTITVDSSRACAIITVQSGATGTLDFGTGTLSVTGNVTFVSGFNLTGTSGVLRLSSSLTLTSGGLSIPNVTLAANGTYTLADALSVTGTLGATVAAPVFAGAYDITCGTLSYGSNQTSAMSWTFVSGQTCTVTSAISLAGGAYISCTIKSSTASSATNLVYNGAAAGCKAAGMTFTDVDYSGSTVTDLDNWYGGTLTRTSGITNRTSADIGGGGVDLPEPLRIGA